MYLDVHGLAFETSIYNRKDQSGICILCISKNASCPKVNYIWDIRESTETQLYRVAVKPTLAWTNHERDNTQLFSFCVLLAKCELRYYTLTMPCLALLCMIVMPSVNTSGQSASYCNSGFFLSDIPEAEMSEAFSFAVKTYYIYSWLVVQRSFIC